MTFSNRWRRRLIGLLAAVAAAVVAAPLVATPAHATYGSPLTVDRQLRSYDSYGYEYLVGRLVGTVQLDDGNSAYRLSLVMCRQSSYTNPHVIISINGSQHQFFSPSDNIRRRDVCGGHGMSGVITGDYGDGGVIPSLTLRFSGIHFDGSTAKDVVRYITLDNPYN